MPTMSNPAHPKNVIMHKNTTFTYHEMLGEGAFGQAFKVTDTKDKAYCLKEVSLLKMSALDRERARREAKLMKRVTENKNHPNIVSFYDSWSSLSQNKLFILMEYVPGGTLEDLLAECRKEGQNLDTAQVGHYLVQLASALDYCHNDMRIVHRDIKPANILVDRMGRLKLADFGLSKMLAAGIDLTSTFAGSPQFMSPEQYRGDYSFPTDVWALGCVMFEIMSFRSPWSASQATGLGDLGRFIINTKPDFSRLKKRYPGVARGTRAVDAPARSREAPHGGAACGRSRHSRTPPPTWWPPWSQTRARHWNACTTSTIAATATATKPTTPRTSRPAPGRRSHLRTNRRRLRRLPHSLVLRFATTHSACTWRACCASRRKLSCRSASLTWRQTPSSARRISSLRRPPS